METIKNIQKISIWFFVVLGAAYLFTGLMEVSGMFKNEAFTVHQTIQIPFIFSALAYGASSLISSIANPEKDNKILFVIIGALCAIILAAIIAIEIIFPDLTLPS